MATNESAVQQPQAQTQAQTTAVTAATQQKQTAAVSPIKAFKAALSNVDVQSRLGQLLDVKQKNVFVASALEVFSSDSNLQKCEPMLVIKEVMKAAALQMPINKNFGFAYVLPYKGVPQFQLGYKAYIQLAQRSGQYRHINAAVIYEGEISKIDKLSGMIELNGKRISDKVVGYFAYFKMLNGFEKMEYMSVTDAAKYAIRYSPSVSGSTSVDTLVAQAGKVGKGMGWLGNFDDMAIKTCLKRVLKKYGYLSIEMQSAFESEREDAEADRNEVVATQANATVVNTEEVEYEEVEEQPY